LVVLPALGVSLSHLKSRARALSGCALLDYFPPYNIYEFFRPAGVHALFDENNFSNTSSSYDSLLSDLSSVQSDHATMVDEIWMPAGFIEYPLFESAHSVQEFNLFDNSPFENARSLSKSGPIHLASVRIKKQPTAPSGTSSRASRVFKCWVETCSHFNEGFLTLKQRRTHYEKAHSHLILTCRVAGCKASPFLRKRDRAKHEKRMHLVQEVEESHTEGPVDVNEIAEINQIFVRHLLQNRLGSER